MGDRDGTQTRGLVGGIFMTGNDVEVMRDQISQVYGPDALRWKLRCKNMPNRQVVAIYLHMKEKGKFDKRRKGVKQMQKKAEGYHQMTLWDFAEFDT